MVTGIDPEDEVVRWLLAGDPAIAWQTRRDVLGEPEAAWSTTRARVAHEGWGAELLAHRDEDGQWAGGAFFPAGFTRELLEREGQPWTATAWALTQLRELGLPPDAAVARRTVALVGAHARWDHAGEPFWAGEVEECINGRTLADGAYFGVDVSPIAARLLGERQGDGGWNCERSHGSTRSSFHTTINVLEGLREYERAGQATDAHRAARHAGEAYLLTRRLCRRASTGAIADPDLRTLRYPCRWRYDVLRALDHLRAAAELDGTPPDPRLAEPVDWLESRRRADGRWPLDATAPGRAWQHFDAAPGEPSRWITLRALRVLRWWATATPAGGHPGAAG